MSTNTPAAPSTFDPDIAYAVVHQRVYVPAFFEKLVAYGIKPQTREDAEQLLVMAAKLRSMHDAAQEKAAAAKVGLLQQAHTALDAELEKMGFDHGQPAADHAIKVAAAQGLFDEDLARAVLSLHVADMNSAAT